MSRPTPILQLSKAHGNASIHLGNPLQPTSQIDLMEMRYGCIMHGICTSKTASYIHCFSMQLHSMLFTFIHLFGILVVQEYVRFEKIVDPCIWGVCIIRSRSMNSLPSSFKRSCALQMIPARTIVAMNMNQSF